MTSARSLLVRARDATYEVTIETGLLARAGAVAAAVCPHERALLVVDERIEGDHGRTVQAALAEAGYKTATVTMVANEATKTLEMVGALYEAMLEHRMERTSPVIALGGGIVGDTAGFAAATFLRGVPFIQVPTTLLAMVDAAIGGKTGVNMPIAGGGLGKNLVGAFWPPRAVLIDPAVLRTLDVRHFRCGLAECVKAAVIADRGLLGDLLKQAAQIEAMETAVLVDLIERCARIKIEIVEADEREAGQRAWLNLGHTFAHALEAQPHLDLHHGEAVAVGLVAAAFCATQTDRLADADAARITEVLEQFGLPVRIPSPCQVEPLMQAMRYDKKNTGGTVRLVLPVALGQVEITDDVPESIVREAWVSVSP